MSAVVPDFRSAVMIVVEASWEGVDGLLQRVSARMEDKSAGGACIRLKAPVKVGSNIRIQWRFEQFSGVVKYCRPDGREFVAGIQRDKNPVVISSPRTEAPLPAREAAHSTPVRSAEKSESPIARPMSRVSAAPGSGPLPQENVLGYRSASTNAREPSPADQERGRPRFSTVRPATSTRRTEVPTAEVQKEIQPKRELGNERKPMKHKWLDLTPWRKKQDGPRASGDGGGTAPSEESNGGNGMDKAEKDRFAGRPSEAQESNQKTAIPAEGGGLPGFPIDMLPPEDVYMAAGILRPRGHGVNKVVEMLHSEHIRDLSKEIKRAAVLMAMEVAGITIEQVEKDAKVRQVALDSYEAQQKKQAEAEWARKAEENARIEAEMERVKAVYLARIDRNDEGVAREKSLFSDWQSTKQKEVDSMTEAVELCGKPKAAAPAPPAPAPITPVAIAALPAPPLAKAVAAGAESKTTPANKPS